MNLDNLLSSIDAEISLLKQARSLLSAANSFIFAKAKSKPRRKSAMSAEGRKRIADAQRKRWASQRKAVR
jgi:hypothetical protein